MYVGKIVYDRREVEVEVRACWRFCLVHIGTKACCVTKRGLGQIICVVRHSHAL
jgi:hypothetical protein